LFTGGSRGWDDRSTPWSQLDLPMETLRLSALRRYLILDTEAERRFDALALLALHVCGTPMALITLVDEHRQ
jgi:hypothetical protein